VYFGKVVPESADCCRTARTATCRSRGLPTAAPNHARHVAGHGFEAWNGARCPPACPTHRRCAVGGPNDGAAGRDPTARRRRRLVAFAGDDGVLWTRGKAGSPGGARRC
jgi:hypothetical protein